MATKAKKRGAVAAKPKARTAKTAGAGSKRKPALSAASRAARKRAKPAAKAAASGRSEAAGDWRRETLARMRALIAEADPAMIEERKWAKASNPQGVPVWSHDGIVCTGETYKSAVKLTFARGASLADPSHLFNAGLGGGTRRAIDIHEGETVDATAFKALVRAAVEKNVHARKR